VCPVCGAPGPAAQAPVAQAAVVGQAVNKTEPMAIASLVSAILGFFMVPILGSILGVVFGNIARRRIAETPGLQGSEMARAGIIIGWVGIVLAALAILLIILLISAFANFT